MQVEPDGKSLKTIVRSYGTYYDNGSIPFSLDEWHQLVFTFDGTNFKTYLDGRWIGTSALAWPIDTNEGSWELVELPMVIIFLKDGSTMFVFTKLPFIQRKLKNLMEMVRVILERLPFLR